LTWNFISKINLIMKTRKIHL